MITQVNLDELYPGKIVTIEDEIVTIFDPETVEEKTESFQTLKDRIGKEQGIEPDEELDP